MQMLAKVPKGDFLAVGESFLRTWQKLLLGFGPNISFANMTELCDSIRDLREACLAEGMHELGVVVRVLEGLVHDIKEGKIIKNDRARHLLIDFHGAFERWLEALDHTTHSMKHASEFLETLMAQGKMLTLANPDGVRTSEKPPIFSQFISSGENSSSSPRGTWISEDTLKGLDQELAHIWSDLVSIEYELKNPEIRTDVEQTLQRLFDCVAYTKEKLAKSQNDPKTSDLCDVLIIEFQEKIMGIPLIDIDATIDLKETQDLPNQPNSNHVFSQNAIIRGETVYPLYSMLPPFLTHLRKIGPTEAHPSMAILTWVKNGPVALVVDRIIQRKKVLLRSSNDAWNHHSIYREGVVLGYDQPFSVLNLKNLQMVSSDCV
jgi:hypothetical protein